MTQKSNLIEPRLPRGFDDRLPGDIAAVDRMLAAIRQVYERYGFDPVETPLFEYTEALGKFLPDTDRPNAGVFSLMDDDEQWMSLRYDLTAPLARHFAENFERLPKPYRSYRVGWVFRNEKPGPGRFRQFMQFDADTVGAAGPEADAEMCMMMADTMDALGLGGQYVVKVNNRKVLEGIRAAAGIVDDTQWLTALRAIDKLDRLGAGGVYALLGSGRKDESGDFTPGAGLDSEQVKRLYAFVAGTLDVYTQPKPEDVYRGTEDDHWTTSSEVLNAPAIHAIDISYDNVALVQKWRGLVGDSEIGLEGVAELEAMAQQFRAAGYGAKRIRLDSSVVRGLEYYTGPVFEIELTFPVLNEKGQQVVFGSVGGGGRYDGLVSRFRSEPVPATGFSIGVSRLAHALKLTGNLTTEEPVGPVVVLVLDKDQTPRYQEIVSRLRKAGIRAEMFLGATRNMRKQLEYADKRNAPAAIIEGSQEREKGIVQIKDLVAGKEAAKTADRAEWTAERPGQFECSDAEIVDRIAALPAVRAYMEGP